MGENLDGLEFGMVLFIYNSQSMALEENISNLDFIK